MKNRVEHYVIESTKGRLLIIQDQMQEMKRAFVFIVIMLISGVVISPYGPYPIGEFSTGVFWIWTIGWCISCGVAYYAMSYQKEHVITRNHIKITEIKSGHRSPSTSIMVGKELQGEVNHQPYTSGPRIANTSVRIGTHELKIFPYTLTVKGLNDGEVRFSLTSGKSVEVLVDAIREVIPLNVDYT